MKNVIATIGLFLVSNIALATDQITEIYSLKNGNLKFVPEYQQCLQEIKQTDSRVQLIPEISKGNTGIPYVILCADVRFSDEKFQKLARIKVMGQTKIPSATLKSGYGGTTTIGGDQITVTTDFPSPDVTSHDFYQVSATIDVVSTDPNARSSQSMSISFDKNGTSTGNKQSNHSVSQIDKYHAFSFHIDLKTTEGGFESPAIPISPRIAVFHSSAFSDHEWEQYKLHYFSTEGLSPTAMWSELPIEKSETSSTSAKVTEHKVSVCWSPNNYTSITMDAAELLNPEVELTYNK